jgi:hypothetical protein
MLGIYLYFVDCSGIERLSAWTLSIWERVGNRFVYSPMTLGWLAWEHLNVGHMWRALRVYRLLHRRILMSQKYANTLQEVRT